MSARVHQLPTAVRQELLTIDEVSEWLRVPKQTLYGWRRDGVGPRASRVGRHLRYRVADVERWLDKQAQPKDHR